MAGGHLAGAGARGFTGIAFRWEEAKHECFYIRPTNGRAEDQQQRNHSPQYISHPDYSWERLSVNGAQQPSLLVNDLKRGKSKGAIALWVGPGSVAHFANLKVIPN